MMSVGSCIKEKVLPFPITIRAVPKSRKKTS